VGCRNASGTYEFYCYDVAVKLRMTLGLVNIASITQWDVRGADP
jgi:hypothetical protein